MAWITGDAIWILTFLWSFEVIIIQENISKGSDTPETQLVHLEY